jgi:hypothetical protein
MREAAAFVAKKPVDCCVTLACNVLAPSSQTAFACIQSRKYSIAPHGDIRYYILSCLPAISIFLRLMAVIKFLSASSWQYQFFLTPHSDNQFFFLGLIVTCLPCSSSFKLNGICTILLRPDCCLLTMFKLLRAERPLHNIPLALRLRPLLAISIYYSPHGNK